MKVYLVGGAVRDSLLNIQIKDRDWVVIGATPEEMVAQGYEAVGKDFPVFLHPKTHEEYALARTERKIAKGYHGFQFNTDSDVTLEQDLARRDLSINAMAQDPAGNLIDPYHGQQDLQDGILRHVSPAFQEDPVRILRVARFAARFDFQVAAETMQLMHQMVASGEVDALVAERVWQELAKALSEPQPQRFFEVLSACGALARILPELDALQNSQPDAWQHTMSYLHTASANHAEVHLSYALLCVHVEQPLQHLHHRLRAPKDCVDAANILQVAYPLLLQASLPTANTMLTVFQRCDVWRRPVRFEQLWQLCLWMAQQDNTPQPHPVWQMALAACLRVDTGAIAQGCADKSQIAAAIKQARLAAIAAELARIQPC